jgi:hypothetical protein
MHVQDQLRPKLQSLLVLTSEKGLLDFVYPPALRTSAAKDLYGSSASSAQHSTAQGGT